MTSALSDKIIPRVSNGVFIQDSPCGKWSQLFKLPIYFVFVLSILIFSPEQLENMLRIVENILTELKSNRIKVMSSANRLILISLLLIVMPFRILFAIYLLHICFISYCSVYHKISK